MILAEETDSRDKEDSSDKELENPLKMTNEDRNDVDSMSRNSKHSNNVSLQDLHSIRRPTSIISKENNIPIIITDDIQPITIGKWY